VLSTGQSKTRGSAFVFPFSYHPRRSNSRQERGGAQGEQDQQEVEPEVGGPRRRRSRSTIQGAATAGKRERGERE